MQESIYKKTCAIILRDKTRASLTEISKHVYGCYGKKIQIPTGKKKDRNYKKKCVKMLKLL